MSDADLWIYSAAIGVPAFVWSLVAVKSILRGIWRDRGRDRA